MISNHVRQRKFANDWDEIGHLYQKVLYWLYNQQCAAKARPYSDRLEKLLPKADPNHEAIIGEECWSLIHETNGDLLEAIKHRENEIRMISQLYAISKGQPFEQTALRWYDISDLSDRLNLLAGLYHDSGDLGSAIATLEESKRLCARHGIAFEAEDVLDEYLKERPDITFYLQASENGTLFTALTAHDPDETMPSLAAIVEEQKTNLTGGRQLSLPEESIGQRVTGRED